MDNGGLLQFFAEMVENSNSNSAQKIKENTYRQQSMWISMQKVWSYVGCKSLGGYRATY